jgi:hypothetical protein
MVLMLCVLVALLPAAAPAPSVDVRDGNVVFTATDGHRVPLTASGMDEQPVLSPDGRWIAFVRRTNRKPIVGVTPEGAPANELWIVSSSGGRARRLVTPRQSADLRRAIGGLGVPVFSPDSRELYFMSAAWATSSAVHVVDIATAKERFVCDGELEGVVLDGEHRGDLVMQRHKYFVGGGSYDSNWLMKANGQEVGPIGNLDGFLLDNPVHH